MIIDKNSSDIVKQYNFSSIIGQHDVDEAIGIIKSIIDSGNYFTNSPPYQTKENIFGRSETVWLKYRMSFLMSVFMYLGREVRVSNMMAWSFMTNTATQENRDTYWHHHDKHGTKSLSGIMYLHIPKDVKDITTCGTEIAPNGPDGDGKYFIQPNSFSWFIYPSETWHRPGIAQSDEYRFIIAADVSYEY